ncbi:MAG TPA: twin-arginine translocation signal domain-containing protein [Gaiellaceae bacterium]|nr:twin-arginine translocation signal domain-containing protein [Gaiellaceae bacterium]
MEAGPIGRGVIMVQETKDLSRRRLLKRVAIGGGVVYAAPFMTSAALAGSEDGNPRCNAIQGPDGPVTCGPDSCAGQTICRGETPVGSFCTCIPRHPGNGNEAGNGQCFCHEASACSDLPPCESSGDCPPGWACATSCCFGGPFCHPPCGTSAAGSIAAVVGAAVPTSVG